MLHLHQSNRTEALFESLRHVLATPLQSVLETEIVVVEEPGMARWLARRLAEETGIAANLDFPLPAGFVWQVINAQLGTGVRDNAFSKPVLQWALMAVLPDLEQAAGFDLIRRYLDAPDRETRLYQLCREIADLFDQYLVYRPDWILQWEAGRETHWQATLWRALRERLPQPHWAALLNTFFSTLDGGGLKPGVLPGRVSLFALSSLSPRYMDLLTALGRYVDIHVYVLNPSEAYWGDIMSEPVQARLRDRARRRDETDITTLIDTGNPLLASMGSSCREFIDLWLEREEQGVDIDYAALPPGTGCLLNRIQQDILDLHTPQGEAGPLTPDDDSIQVHRCYSALREVEVLHDRLLALFDGRPDLAPHDVVVMVPDINAWAASIDAVFGAAPPERHIPFSISGQSPGRQPVVEVLMQWLALPRERFEASTVMSWLDLPAVQRRFNLDANAVERIRDWVADSGIRWGLDAGHKAELGLPAEDRNTWAFGFRRLYLGYALDSGVELFRGVAPASADQGGGVEGSEAAWLGELQRFLQLLTRWRQEFASPATAQQWQQRLGLLIEQCLFPDDDESRHLDLVRRQMGNLVQQVELGRFGGDLSAALLQQYLGSALNSGGQTFNLLNGKVTFTSMTPVRSVPFRVVCLLGMNDGGFPRTQRPPGFDLMTNGTTPRRKGDRNLRDDDRFLFLEALLSAREVLHISYVGNSQQDNSEKQPSVVVSELLDLVASMCGNEDSPGMDNPVIRQPLQPFSPKAFINGSYAAEWFVPERAGIAQPFYRQPLQAEEGGEAPCVIALDSLVAFVINPARHFLGRIGVRAADFDESLDDVEPFAADGLTGYRIREKMLELTLAGREPDTIRTLLAATGILPHGVLGNETFSAVEDSMSLLLEEIHNLPVDMLHRDVELEVSGCTVKGRIPLVVDDGVLGFRAANGKPGDWLRLWVLHLVHCAAGGSGAGRHLAPKEGLVLNPVAADEALAHLDVLLGLYRRAATELVPLIPNGSRRFVESENRGGNPEEALADAARLWAGDDFRRGDGDDGWLAQAWQDRDPFDADFMAVSRAVWKPLLGYRKSGRGA